MRVESRRRREEGGKRVVRIERLNLNRDEKEMSIVWTLH